MAQTQADAAAQMQQIIAQNRANRDWCLKNGVHMSLPVDSRTLTGTIPGQQTLVPMRPTGLLKSILVKAEFDITTATGETLTRSAIGPGAIFSNISFLDLNNNTRISVPGWYLTTLATMRRGSAFASVFTNNSPAGVGADNFSAILCPSSVAATTTQHVRMFFEVPIAYSEQDLRGAIPLNVTGATAQLQLTVNPNIIAGSGVADATETVYQSSAATPSGVSNFKITTYQNFIDQLPAPMLPILDLQTVYQLQYTALTGMAVGQDYPVQYGNQREFYSTTLWLDQNGALNNGSDVNYFALTTANFTNLWKKDPQKAALDVRMAIGDDCPPGMYYFDHRKAPINTATFGNMQLMVNLSSVASATGSIIKVGWEFFTMVQLATRISSLAAG